MVAANNTPLISKYDVPTPRYTSYPTVPYWDNEAITEKEWTFFVRKSFAESKNISLYLHLPFCEELCTYCGCNKRITVNHGVESPYISALLKEWQMYRDIFGEKPIINELHLGGGTPTFFSPENLRLLLEKIFEHSIIPEDAEFSIEVHPNNTKKAHLEVLYDLGFRRLSVGIQDFDPVVQFAINRIQTFEQTEKVFNEARAIGFTSINADIIYGLPFQTLKSVEDTIEGIKSLKPERIAFYSYAHVPWKSKSQRRYDENNLPSAEIKRNLYETGKHALQEAGYMEIGMDHFALEDDSLYKAKNNGELHRNFMGYTTQNTNLLIGLGASSISDSWDCFVQNIKEVEEYQKTVMEGNLPIFRGHSLNKEDLFIRKHILNLMCKEKTSWDISFMPDYFIEGLLRVMQFKDDGLIELGRDYLIIKPEGKAFIRNICMCFDARLWRKLPDSPVFSKSI
jgi:oxygen-independent coproporphyrinogen III oxidase